MAMLYRQRGISLVEMMIASTLSIIIGAGIIQVFISNKRVYKVQEAVSRLQENGRFASEFISDDMRMVGFNGCAGKSGITVNNNVDFSKTHGSDPAYTSELEKALTDFDGSNSLRAYYVNATPDVKLTDVGFTVGTGEGQLVEGTVVLKVIRGGSCPGADVTATGNAGIGAPPVSTAQMKIADNSICQVKQNDIVMVSDCVKADIFGVSNTPTLSPGMEATITHGANWNTSPQFAEAYNTDAGFYKVYAYYYYVAYGEFGQPSLFRRRIGTSLADNFGLVSEELVEGIEKITYFWGLDTSVPPDKVADKYVQLSSGTVTLTDAEWSQVVSVRITVSGRTLDDNLRSKTDNVNNDKRIRREFTTTVTIRNRAAG